MRWRAFWQPMHETRKRIGQWKAEIKEAAKARQIRAVDRLYADELLAFPSVARGHYSLCSDATMGQRLDVSDSTARRRRRRLDKAGLIEVLGYGQDGNSCLVRPILRDGEAFDRFEKEPTKPKPARTWQPSGLRSSQRVRPRRKRQRARRPPW
jgi:hypothetical protein